jgi:phosphatidylserine synthase
MGHRTKAWLEFGVFCAVFCALIVTHQHYHSLDHWMALIWLVFLVTAGAYALARPNTSRSHYGMPTFLGILPLSWQRWFLGEGGGKNDE